MLGVGRVVRHEAVDRAVDDALAQRKHVALQAQRRVHLQVRVVGAVDVILVQEQVVRGDLARDGQPLGLCCPHQVQALLGGDVRDVQRAAGESAELDVAVDLELLAQGRPAKHAEARGRLALVDDAVGREGLVLAVRDRDAIELRHVAHAGAHHAGALHTVAVVAEGAGALEHHVADLREGLSLLAAGERADRADVAEPGRATAVDLVADAGARVGHGVGVRHGRYVREAAVRRGARAGLDGLLVLEAGVAEVHVHVDEAGNQVLARGIDDLGALRGLQVMAHLDDLLSVEKDVDYLVESDLRVDGVCALKQKCHCSLLPEAGTSRPCG